MKHKKLRHFIALLLLNVTYSFIAQDLSLKITSNKKEDLKAINKIEYNKKHKDPTSIFIETKKISQHLKEIGYFTNSIDSITKENKRYTAYFSLNDKIKQAIITTNKNIIALLEEPIIMGDTIFIAIEKLKPTLLHLSNILESKGKSFSKIQLENIKIKKEFLYADLNIHQSKGRIINKIIIKGYEDFPKSYLKNHYNINKKTIFNQKKINEISNTSKNLEFAKEIKPPEVLFKTDSTLIYMYLKKNKNSSFDGIINFASDEEGRLLFNGNLDLKLNNILNTGEKFRLFWNSIGKERQEFKLNTSIPYVFNSKFSTNLSFSIYKQDSSFINTKFDTKLFYNINTKIKIAATYNLESSEKLEELTNDNTETFKNYFFGFQFNYNIPKNDIFFNNKFSIEINPAFGIRTVSDNNNNQVKIQASTSYIWDLNQRNSIYIKNTLGHLKSNNYIDNEIFRIGGSNSLRGFSEQSIFTNQYTYLNLEYRNLTSSSSYLYTISDYAILKEKKLLGIGLGHRLIKNNSTLNINIVFGNNLKNNFKLKNPQLNINYAIYF